MDFTVTIENEEVKQKLVDLMSKMIDRWKVAYPRISGYKFNDDCTEAVVSFMVTDGYRGHKMLVSYGFSVKL